MSTLTKSVVLFIIICVITARDEVLSYIPVVLLGYDVVAYHLNVTGCGSIRGNKQYSYQLSSTDNNGILRLYSFWFADENNYNIFKNDPWKYAPRFGGFCSFAEQKASSNWNATFQGPACGPDKINCGFRVHGDGYLYLNLNQQYDDMFFSDTNTNIQSVEERWIEWFGSLEAGPFNHHCFSTNGHNTADDCVTNAQRYAPAANIEDEIYDTDNEYYDDWFDKWSQSEECPLICKHCPDGSCQKTDENCNYLVCPANSFFLFGVIGIGILLGIVVVIAFICIRKKNTYLTENFDQLADHEEIANATDKRKANKNKEEVQNHNEQNDSVHEIILQSEETQHIITR